MNKCYFVGKLKYPTVLSQENGVDVVNFSLEIEEFRRNKNGKKTRDVNTLYFEAWDTAATTIHQKLNIDDLMLVECAARSIKWENDSCYFRITYFKIINNCEYIDD